MRRLLYLLLISVLMQSCAATFIPATQSVPLFEEKGEYHFEAGASTNSLYANAATALTNYLGVSVGGNVSYGNFSNRYDIFTLKNDSGIVGSSSHKSKGDCNHVYGEASVGLLNIDKESGGNIFELFGGFGMGASTSADYYSFFLQGNSGTKEKRFEGGVSMRIGYSLFNYPEEKFGGMSFEPMGFMRIGGEHLKVDFRGGLNFLISNATTKIDVHHSTVLHFSVGLTYRFGNNRMTE
ncbi:MAG: hypothetical protein FWC39_09350 [Bacteroidetes bacterium]|nr:hypothetical protein [Bacteroidota bacterium]